MSYKLCSKIQITLSNLHDHNRIKLCMLITARTSRNVLVTGLSLAGQLPASLSLTVCAWPLPELFLERAWPLRVFFHHLPRRDSWNIELYSFIFCTQQGGTERERERGRERKQTGGGSVPRGNMGQRQRGIWEGRKGRGGEKQGRAVLGITAETSLEPQSVPLIRINTHKQRQSAR